MGPLGAWHPSPATAQDVADAGGVDDGATAAGSSPTKSRQMDWLKAREASQASSRADSPSEADKPLVEVEARPSSSRFDLGRESPGLPVDASPEAPQAAAPAALAPSAPVSVGAVVDGGSSPQAISATASARPRMNFQSWF